jgi:tetratricopeptide (TPR) repeat protein
LSQIERLSEKATDVRFEAGKVSNAFTRIRGERVIRAAWLGSDQGGAEEWMFRCTDAQKCERWLLSEAERQFIRGFESFKSATDATPAQRALLELLSRDDAVECMQAPVPTPTPEPDARAEEVSWAALLDDNPPDVSIVAMDNRPPVVSNVPMDNRPPVVSMVPTDDHPPVVSIVPTDDHPPVVSNVPIDDHPPVASIVPTDDRLPVISTVRTDDDHTPIVPIVANGHTRPTVLAEPKVEAPRAVWVEIAKRASPVEEIRAIEPAQSGVKRNEPVTELEQALWRVSATLADDGLPNQSIGGEVAMDEEISVAIGPLLGASAGSETFSDNEENVPDDPSNSEQAARARRQRLLRRAVENIGGLGARPAEAPGFAMEKSGVEPAPAPPSAGAPSPEEMELVASLERKFHQIETHVDHFALLGVPRAATDEEVKAAFLELAKVFHPDRLPGSLQHLLAKMREVFETVREAYETLQSESSRARYEAGLDAEKPPKEISLSPAEEAAEAFKRGEVLFRKRDFAGAERDYHRAYLLDSKANYLAAEAWAIHLNPERREQAPMARQMMVEASKKDPSCERAQYQLGVIARVEGEIDRAEKHFREAVRLNSKYLEARQELRLIEMRKKKGRSR